MTRSERAWRVLGEVLDPEVPALSVCDLGIVAPWQEAVPALVEALRSGLSGRHERTVTAS